MNKEIKAIFFDIGGVLYDENDFLIIHRSICKKFSLNYPVFLSKKGVYQEDATLGRISPSKYYIGLAKSLGINANNLRNYREKQVMINLKFREGIRAILKKLKKDFYLGSFTNVINIDNPLREKKRFYKYFDLNIISNVEGIKKPSLNFYKLMSKKSGFLPSEILFIDDSEKYLLPAKKLGIQTILFKNCLQFKRELNSRGIKL